MPITFEGVGAQWEPSAVYRKRLADSGDPVILSFSRGKDSLAAWLALLDSGVDPDNILPVYYYRVPGLRFTAESLDKYEKFFNTKIHRLPHPSLYGQLQIGSDQPIHRTGFLIAMDLPNVSYADIEREFRADRDLDPNTVIITGVRASDGIARRTKTKRTGPYTEKNKTLAGIWDWTQTECYERIADAGINLEEFSPDYRWFAKINPRTGKPVKNSGRTFDGFAYQFLKPLQRYAPDDYATILDWFPMLETEMIRHEQL